MTRENIADDSNIIGNLLTDKYNNRISKIEHGKDRWIGGRALIRMNRWKWCTLLLVLATAVFGLIYQGVTVGLLAALVQLVFIFACAKLSFFHFSQQLSTSVFSENVQRSKAGRYMVYLS